MRLLLSAFACDTVTGSECYVGWSWATRLAKKHDLTVLTRTYSARLIAEHAPEAGLNLIHFDLPFCAGKNHYWRFIKPYYVLWQMAALFFVLWHHLARRFEVIHHLTYNVIEMPGFLGFVPGAKFVWGPVGGGQVPPESLKEVYGKGWLKQRIRRMSKRLSPYYPHVVFAAWRARHVFFANAETAKLIQRYCRSSSIMLETAIDPPPLAAKEPHAGLRLLWLGNVIDRKALIIAMEALGKLFARRPDIDVTLTVAGDGPMLPAAKARAEDLGITSHCEFRGRVPFAEVMGLVEACDAFLFTSVQDTSGNVVLEAMSRGAPVITLDHQGAAVIVTEASGQKVPVGEIDAVAEGFAKAIERYADDPALRERAGAEAHAEIERSHRWDSRMETYEAVLARI
ncbi:MAG: glycosyltransferase family 4 protein [Sphingomonadaceae bacterium]